VIPLDRFPAGLQSVLELLPVGALSTGLRDVLQNGSSLPWDSLAVVMVWAFAGLAAAAATFRWE
jgi:ABC-2 type transport system permease protein